MMSQVDYEAYRRHGTVNNAIKICVTCGNVGVKIDHDHIYCNNCDSKFYREESMLPQEK